MSESDEGSVFDPDDAGDLDPEPDRPERSRSTLPSSIAAAVLSFVAPGVGHVLRGLWWRGLLWFALAVASAIVIPLWVGLLWLHLLIRVTSAIDAWRARGTGETSHWIGALAVSLVVFAGLRVFLFEGFKIPSASMSPTLQIGDHLMTNKAAYWFEDPARGDVIVFEYPCNRKVDFVKRVVAVGGDTVEVRCEKLYVNGDKVDDEFIDEPCEYLDHDSTLLGMTAGTVRYNTFCSRYRETLGDATYEILSSPMRPRDEDEVQVAGAGYGDSQRDFPRDSSAMPSCVDQSNAAGSVRAVAGASGGSCRRRLEYVVPNGHVFVLGDNRYNASDSRQWGSVPLDLVKGRVTYLWWAAPPGGDVDWSRIGGI